MSGIMWEKRDVFVCLTWMTFPYWMTDPMHFFVSVSFCFFSTSAACWNTNRLNSISVREIVGIPDFLCGWARKAQKVFEELHAVFLSLRSVGYQLQLFSHPLFCLVARKEQKKVGGPIEQVKNSSSDIFFPSISQSHHFPTFFHTCLNSRLIGRGRKFVSFIQDGPCAETFQFQKVWLLFR